MTKPNQTLKFDTFVTNAAGVIEVVNIKNFELWVLCSTAVGYLNKTTEVMKTEGKPSNFEGGIRGYMEHAAQHIFNIANTEGGQCENPTLRPMADRLIAAMGRARDTMLENLAKMKVGSFEKEFWWFYSLWVNEFIDNVVVSADTHKAIKGDAERFKHHTKVVSSHGDNKWVHSVRLEDGGSVRIGSFFNNNPMDRYESYGVEPLVNKEEDIVDYVLQNIAMWVATDRCFEFAVKSAIKDKGIVEKAQAIADILGGDYKPYLLTAKYFNQSLKSIVSTTIHSEHEAATLILERELRVTGSEIKQILAALKK